MKNIVLIGMPGAGKSTIGVVLAKILGMDFVDTDLIIQKIEKTTLQNIIDEKGVDEFRNIENRVLSEVQLKNSVIATGGSAVYGKEAMENLQKDSLIVYLKLSGKSLEERLSNLKTRGVAMKKGQTIADLYEERRPLYEKYANITIDCENMILEQSVEMVKKAILAKEDK